MLLFQHSCVVTKDWIDKKNVNKYWWIDTKNELIIQHWQAHYAPQDLEFLKTFLDLQIIYKGLEILGENEQKIQFFPILIAFIMSTLDANFGKNWHR